MVSNKNFLAPRYYGHQIEVPRVSATTGVDCISCYYWRLTINKLNGVLLRQIGVLFRLEALVNEDTLPRTHCCPLFLGLRKLGNICWGHKMFLSVNKIRNIFLCPGHKICVRNKCCARGQMGKHLCRHQCVRSNVSSFARALTRRGRRRYKGT